jgi:nucleoside 2-deoxyribosyltransferase
MPKVIYFAGKVRGSDDYRQKLLGSSHCMSDYGKEYFIGKQSLIYGGPLAISCDHRCFHMGDSRHGCGYEGNTCVGFEYGSDRNSPTTEVDGFLPKEQIVSRCLHEIHHCDAVHAYIDSFDCFGTLVELGYAAASNKPVYLVLAEKLRVDDGGKFHDFVNPEEESRKDELWFVKNLPNVVWCYGNELTIHKDLLSVSSKSIKVDDNSLRNRLNKLWEGQE